MDDNKNLYNRDKTDNNMDGYNTYNNMVNENINYNMDMNLKNKRKKFSLLSFILGNISGILITILLLFFISIQLYKDGNNSAKKMLIDELIKNYYLYEYNEEDLNEYSLKGYVTGLGDPYSVYYDKDETKDLLQMTSGNYSGIGAVLSLNENGYPYIVKVYENSPAQKSGIKDGDIITKIDGEEIKESDLNKIVSLIKGEKKTVVKLTIYRNDKENEYEVIRDTIDIPVVTYKKLDDKTGYIELSEFSELAPSQFKAAYEKMDGIESLVVDLRDNPGGNLDAVLEILDSLLDKGELVYTIDKSGNKEEYNSTDNTYIESEIKLSVLVNENSASASEIFAGCIKDRGRGKIIGSNTYGKGIVQQLFDLGDDTILKLTISEYFTPSGNKIHEVGIKPDIEIEDDENTEVDEVIEKGKEVLE